MESRFYQEKNQNGIEFRIAIHEKLKLPQSSVSHHLIQLSNGGMVARRRDCKQVFYSPADLSQHRLGRKSEFVKAGSNTAKFGPAELVLPKTLSGSIRHKGRHCNCGWGRALRG